MTHPSAEALVPPSQSEVVYAHDSIARSEQVPGGVKLTGYDLPWAGVETDIVQLSAASVGMKDEMCPDFLFASAVGTSDKLVEAAEAMHDGQKRSADNMFWSRIGGFIANGYHPKVETLPEPVTDTPIHVMRSPAGQRVYFAVKDLADGKKLVIRLAVCDKNKQSLVMRVISAAGQRKQQKMRSES